MNAPIRAQSLNSLFEETSFLYGGNAGYIEDLQVRFQADPASVNAEWRDFFGSLNDDEAAVRGIARGAPWARPSVSGPENPELIAALDGNWARVEQGVRDKLKDKAASLGRAVGETEILQATRDTVRALMMIRAYRTRGHYHADLDPLGLEPLKDHEELQPSTYGFDEADWDRRIFIDGVLGRQFSTPRELLAVLKATYCTTTGYEFMHISDPAQKAWLQERIEGADRDADIGVEAKRAILSKLVQVKGYERFLDKKFVGTKRFGLDGAEAAIPALEQILATGAELGVTDVVIGMAHRGRLNVLSQVLNKPHRAIFHEFKGGAFFPDEAEGSGDAKYHLGASADRMIGGRPVHLSLTANPSHLEIVDPVVLGKVRAKQDQNGDMVERSTALPLLIHGDAAFAGQGVVAECFGLSGLKGYRTGGSVHFIINNQIGFTTDPRYSRSSPYPSDVAKMIEAPIFHVNGDDPEAVIRVAKLAIAFRQTFGKPVVIDMFCFRLYGHNEGDEPAFTQPLMYQAIRSHPSTLEIYGDKLVAEGLITDAEIEQAKADWLAHLETELEASASFKPARADWLDGRWAGLTPGRYDSEDPRRGQTAVAAETLAAIGQRLTALPAGFKVHATIQRFLDNRKKMFATREGLDWATAEALAFGALSLEGTPVRLSGQDSERGTFTQRHLVLHDQNTGERYAPLQALSEQQARFEVINSLLSEVAVLGFEYGYTLAEPNALVLWEAQFGDFANGAQVMFDQFLSSGERKWLRMSGLVCLLPHGFDGAGPEHSSARLERFLQLSAEDNWQVANCTTPANYFHILRRQVKRDFRKPLILMTPKSLLRHKRAVSTLADLAEGSAFHRILRDDAETRPGGGLTLAADDRIRRVILCSGKVYYDLLEEREKRGLDDIYLLRLEQLYPFPLKALTAELGRFKAAEVVWCQEEPRNMGAWGFVEPWIEYALDKAGAQVRRPAYAGRPGAASPATGMMGQHVDQQQALVDQALRA